MNVFRVLAGLPKALLAVQDLAGRLLVMHDDPEFKAAIAASPNLKAQSDAISKDARDIQEAFK